MTTSTLTRPSHRSASADAVVRQLPARFVAPPRFDIHHIEQFEGWLAGLDDVERVEIDLGGTDFLDLAALGAIERSAERFGTRFVIARTSPAVSLSIELAELFRGGEQLEQAA